MAKNKILAFGEIMLRLSTPNNEKFIQADEFDICYGGFWLIMVDAKLMFWCHFHTQGTKQNF